MYENFNLDNTLSDACTLPDTEVGVGESWKIYFDLCSLIVAEGIKAKNSS